MQRTTALLLVSFAGVALLAVAAGGAAAADVGASCHDPGPPYHFCQPSVGTTGVADLGTYCDPGGPIGFCQPSVGTPPADVGVECFRSYNHCTGLN